MTRLELHEKLVELLGTNHVYYQPPENLKIEYPAIVYYTVDIDSTYANNATYLLTHKYEAIVIDRRPDNPVIDKLLQLPMARFNRHYKSDNLDHDVIQIKTN